MPHDMREEGDSKDLEHLRNQRGQRTVDQCLQSAERPRRKQGFINLQEAGMQLDYYLWGQAQEMRQKSRDEHSRGAPKQKKKACFTIGGLPGNPNVRSEARTRAHRPAESKNSSAGRGQGLNGHSCRKGLMGMFRSGQTSAVFHTHPKRFTSVRTVPSASIPCFLISVGLTSTHPPWPGSRTPSFIPQQKLTEHFLCARG